MLVRGVEFRFLRVQPEAHLWIPPPLTRGDRLASLAAKIGATKERHFWLFECMRLLGILFYWTFVFLLIGTICIPKCVEYKTENKPPCIN